MKVQKSISIKCKFIAVSLIPSVDIDRGELELPEELPYFPYEKELEEELRYLGLLPGVADQFYFYFFSIQTL